MPYDIGTMIDENPRLSASLAATASAPTIARALAAYDAALAGSNQFSMEDAAHLLAAAARRPKAPARAAAPASFPSALLAALKPLTAAMEKRNTIPVVGTALLTGAGGKLAMTSTDLDIMAETAISYDGEDFSIAVDPWKLAGLLKGATTVRFEVETTTHGDSESHQLILETDAGRSVLAALPPGEFPIMADFAPAAVAMVDSAAWREALTFITPYISTEETRYYLNGANLHAGVIAGEKVLRFRATDGHRAAMQSMPAPEWDGELPENVIIPRKTVAWLVKHLPEQGDVMVEISAAKLKVTAQGVTMTSKLIDGNFPDMDRVIPSAAEEGTAIFTVEDPRAFATAVARLTTLSQDRSVTVRLTISDKVEAMVRNHEGGRATADLPVVSCNGDLSLDFNGKYLLEALKEPGTIRLYGANSPIRVDFPGRGDRVAVLMPLRV